MRIRDLCWREIARLGQPSRRRVQSHLELPLSTSADLLQMPLLPEPMQKSKVKTVLEIG